MKIGLTYTGSPEKHENYIRWLSGRDKIEIITLSTDGMTKQPEHIDGLVLSGGTDIYPGYYGSNNLVYPFAPKSFDEKRDELEISLFHSAQQKHIPVLGVCRGFQLINCIYDGVLEQDIGETLNVVHKAIVDENKIQRDKAHGLNIGAGTLLESFCGPGRFVVNSAHHQAVKKTGSDLKANCMADDGTIEGVEWADPSGKPFLLAIQWHPERMYKFQLENSPLSKTIRDKFIEAIKNNR